MDPLPLKFDDHQPSFFNNRIDGLSNKPSHYHDVFVSGGRTLKVGGSSLRFYGCLVAFDEDTSVLFDNLKLGQRIEGWSIFDVTRSNIEAG